IVSREPGRELPLLLGERVEELAHGTGAGSARGHGSPQPLKPSDRASARIFSPCTACLRVGGLPLLATRPRLNDSDRCHGWRLWVSLAQAARSHHVCDGTADTRASCSLSAALTCSSKTCAPSAIRAPSRVTSSAVRTAGI